MNAIDNRNPILLKMNTYERTIVDRAESILSNVYYMIAMTATVYTDDDMKDLLLRKAATYVTEMVINNELTITDSVHVMSCVSFIVNGKFNDFKIEASHTIDSDIKDAIENTDTARLPNDFNAKGYNVVVGNGIKA